MIGVIGAHGFLGSHIFAELEANDHDVTDISRSELNCAAATREAVRAVTSSLWSSTNSAPTIIYCAAPDHYDTDETKRNIHITTPQLIAEEIQETDGTLVYLSTTEVYGYDEDFDYTNTIRESSAFAPPLSLYAQHKQDGEAACLAALPSTIIPRIFLPYGFAPGGKRGNTVAEFVAAALAGKPLRPYREIVRSWCHASDIAAGICIALDELSSNLFNIGNNGDHRAMEELAAMICDATNAPHDLIEPREAPDPSTEHRTYSVETITAAGWAPEVSLEEGIEMLVRDYESVSGR